MSKVAQEEQRRKLGREYWLFCFVFNFIEVQFTYNKLHLFKVHNSIVLTRLCTHMKPPPSTYMHISIVLVFLQVPLLFLAFCTCSPRKLLANFVPVRINLLLEFYVWFLLCLAFPWHNPFEIDPCSYMYQ